MKDFANWLWDRNRLRINSQIPGIRNADEMVDSYLTSVRRKEPTELSNCNKPAVIGRSEQLLAVAEYVYNHFDDSSTKTAKDYLEDFLSQ